MKKQIYMWPSYWGNPVAAKATADLFIKDGEVQDEWKDLGGQSVALPGLLKTMDIVLKKYGTMTLKDVAAPAIRCARNGFGTSYTGALTMYDNSVERKMRLSEAFRKLYLKEDGSFYRFGEIQKNQEIADLLENIAEQGVDYFYKGKVAKQIVDLIMIVGVVLMFLTWRVMNQNSANQ